MGQGCGSGLIFVETEALWRKKLKAEANLEATNLLQSWKLKQKYSTASTSLVWK